jgi:hypothetical protein
MRCAFLPLASLCAESVVGWLLLLWLLLWLLNKGRVEG